MKKLFIYAILAIFTFAVSCDTKEQLATEQEEETTELTEVAIPSNFFEQDTVKEEVYDAELDLRKTLSEIKCAPDSPVKGKDLDVIGEWKLMQACKRDGFGEPIDTIDMSCDNVYFEFENDSILQVLGNSNLLKQGSYKYMYRILEKGDSLSLPGPNLDIKINDSLYFSSGSYCFVKPYKMRILHHFGNTSVVEIFIRTK